MASRRNPIRTVKIADALEGGKAARDHLATTTRAERYELITPAHDPALRDAMTLGSRSTDPEGA